MKKRIFFFGTPKIAVPALEKIAGISNFEIVGVGCPSDKKIGRKRIITSCPVKNSAKKLNLKIYEVNNKKEVTEIYEKTEFDLAIVIAFGVIFSSEILDKPKFGTINVHFSLLPKFRGASPVQSAILAGEKESGITFQQMKKELDAGDILWQKKWEIRDKPTSELWEFFAEKTAEEVPKFLKDFFANNLQKQKQDKKSVTFCGKLQKKDGQIDFKKETAKEIWHKYLAFDVWPRIFVETKYGSVKIGKISREFTKNSLLINCKNSEKIYIEEVQLPGKKMINIKDILNSKPDLFY